MVKNRESGEIPQFTGDYSGVSYMCHDRKPVFRTVDCDVVIRIQQLLMGSVQGKDFDSWVFHPNPSDHFGSGLFRCRMPDHKEVVMLD